MVGTGPRWMFSQHCTVVLEVGFYGVFWRAGSCAPLWTVPWFFPSHPLHTVPLRRYHLHQLYWWRVSTLWTNRLFLRSSAFCLMCKNLAKLLPLQGAEEKIDPLLEKWETRREEIMLFCRKGRNLYIYVQNSFTDCMYALTLLETSICGGLKCSY